MCVDKALIQNNARIAADIAVALADRRRITSRTPPETVASTAKATTTTATTAMSADAPTAVNKVPVSYVHIIYIYIHIHVRNVRARIKPSVMLIARLRSV